MKKARKVQKSKAMKIGAELAASLEESEESPQYGWPTQMD